MDAHYVPLGDEEDTKAVHGDLRWREKYERMRDFKLPASMAELEYIGRLYRQQRGPYSSECSRFFQSYLPAFGMFCAWPFWMCVVIWSHSRGMISDDTSSTYCVLLTLFFIGFGSWWAWHLLYLYHQWAVKLVFHCSVDNVLQEATAYGLLAKHDVLVNNTMTAPPAPTPSSSVSLSDNVTRNTEDEQISGCKKKEQELCCTYWLRSIPYRNGRTLAMLLFLLTVLQNAATMMGPVERVLRVVVEEEKNDAYLFFIEIFGFTIAIPSLSFEQQFIAFQYIFFIGAAIMLMLVLLPSCLSQSYAVLYQKMTIIILYLAWEDAKDFPLFCLWDAVWQCGFECFLGMIYSMSSFEKPEIPDYSWLISITKYFIQFCQVILLPGITSSLLGMNCVEDDDGYTQCWGNVAVASYENRVIWSYFRFIAFLFAGLGSMIWTEPLYMYAQRYSVTINNSPSFGNTTSLNHPQFQLIDIVSKYGLVIISVYFYDSPIVAVIVLPCLNYISFVNCQRTTLPATTAPWTVFVPHLDPPVPHYPNNLIVLNYVIYFSYLWLFGVSLIGSGWIIIGVALSLDGPIMLISFYLMILLFTVSITWLAKSRWNHYHMQKTLKINKQKENTNNE